MRLAGERCDQPHGYHVVFVLGDRRVRKILVAGWFSFKEMGASAGDLMARDVVCEWLSAAGRDHDVALAQPFIGGVDWTKIDPQQYSTVVFVCGPFGNGWPVTDLLQRFSLCR